MLHLFQGFGVEIEWMIVDRQTWSPRPLADALLTTSDGILSELPRGTTRWSNELARHVIETKTNGPTARLEGLAAAFQADAVEMNALLEPYGACVMGTALHPFFAPQDAETWPHSRGEIYRALDNAFGLRGHAWLNLQSMHLNLPFADDDEFRRLHEAVRLVLPIVPALAASSPFIDGRRSTLLDARLDHYRATRARLPMLVGRIIPERVRTREEYEERILYPIYDALRPIDPSQTLAVEWINGRGAIPRFERMALEIRLPDAQETPIADFAIAAAMTAVIRALAMDLLPGDYAPRRSTERLAELLDAAIRNGDKAIVEDASYLRAFGLRRDKMTMGEMWAHLIARCPPAREHHKALDVIIDKGPLARRMLHHVETVDRKRLEALCAELAACLPDGRMLGAD